MSRAETLHDMVYRETFKTGGSVALRGLLQSARRFVLDEGMSGFLSDLSFYAFKTGLGVAEHERRRVVCDIVDGMRVAARAPFSVTWIEFDMRAMRRRTIISYYKNLAGPSEVPVRTGWLVEQHSSVDTTFRVTGFEQLDETTTVALPYRWNWSVNDALPAWKTDKYTTELNTSAEYSRLATAVDWYESDKITCSAFRTGRAWNDGANGMKLLRMMRETKGQLRHLWALLSVINDVPVLRREVKRGLGFFGQGRYRQFLDHVTVTLRVPQKQTVCRLAQHLIARSRRRAHEVRGHWRLYQRGEGVLCRPELHRWRTSERGTALVCEVCPAWRSWITQHERGDASLGFVTHDYSVQRGAA